MKRDTIIAVIVAIICMLIYIRIRFKDIRFGLSSVIALMHDVLVVLAFYAAARVSVSNTFVACMLTIVGYSINATMYFFGVSSIKDFALPLMVGIGCGCYSSVCLAGAFWVILSKKFPAKEKN